MNGRVDDVKTEYSHDHVPIHESRLKVLLAWVDRCPATEDGWIFPSHLTNKPYYSTEIQKRFLKPIGIELGLGPSAGIHSATRTAHGWMRPALR